MFTGVMFVLAVALFFSGVLIGYTWGNSKLLERVESNILNDQFQKTYNQNMRYVHELRILNKKHRRMRLLLRKISKERDALKTHFGNEEAMTVIRSLYPDQNLDHLEDGPSVNT